MSTPRAAWLGADEIVEPPARSRAPAWAEIAIALAVIAYLGLVVEALRTGNANLLGALWVAIGLTAIVWFIAARLAAADGRPELVPMLLGAFGLKMLGTLVRYFVSYTVYGISDASGYHRWGELLGPQIRGLDFSFEVNGIPGTGFVRLLTGILYAVTGSSLLGGFLTYSFIAFLGMVLCWRAFRIGVPRGAHDRYFLLLFLLPSLLYWPSSIGKEAWMLFALGLCSYGTARAFNRHVVSGVVVLLVGIAGVTLVRPHVSIVLFNGLVFAALLRKPSKDALLGPVTTLLIAALLLGLGLVLVQRLETFLGVETLTTEVVQDKLDEAQGHTSQGGSEFTPVRVRTPLDFPLATATILYRPLPFEVRNAQGLIASVEGVILAAITVISWPRLRQTFRAVRDMPYVGYCLGFLVSFVVAFSAFGNFGILARQRVQLLPMFLALLCLPTAAESRAAVEAESATATS